jgi:hypothetical protein
MLSGFMIASPDDHKSGFGRTDLLILLAVVLFVAGGVSYPLLKRPVKRHSKVFCQTQLRHIGVSFELFAADHGGSFPTLIATTRGGTLEYLEDPSATYRHFVAVSNPLGDPKLLICPSDRRSPASDWQSFSNQTLSYFVGLNADRSSPNSLLAGDRNVATNLSIIAATNAIWQESLGLHGNEGYILFSDGRVELSKPSKLHDMIQQPENMTNRLAVP